MTFCGQEGFVDPAVEMWHEWNNHITEFSSIIQSAVIATFSTNPITVPMVCQMLEEMTSTLTCDPEMDVRVISAAIKCASNAKRFDLAKLVWEWSEPIRKHELQCTKQGKGGDVAIVYAQFAMLCGQEDYAAVAIEIWREWNEAVIAINAQAQHQDVFHAAVMATLSTDSKTLSVACEMLENLLAVGSCQPNTGTLVLGAALKCAGNVHRFDLPSLLGNGLNHYVNIDSMVVVEMIVILPFSLPLRDIVWSKGSS